LKDLGVFRTRKQTRTEILSDYYGEGKQNQAKVEYAGKKNRVVEEAEEKDTYGARKEFWEKTDRCIVGKDVLGVSRGLAKH